MRVDAFGSFHCILFTLPREKVNIAALVHFLYKQASPSILPKSPKVWCLEVALVVHAHHSSDRLRGFDGVIERDTRGMVVQHMRLDCAVEEHSADEPKITVYGGCRTTEKSPGSGWVVGNGEICVL